MNTLILASASKSRSDLLKGAGLDIKAIPSHVDEDILKQHALSQDWSVEKTALYLAKAKAESISQQFPDALVLGCDQMMDCEGVWFDKPTSLDGAKAQLKALRGKTHRLISSVCVIKDKECQWTHSQFAELEMRDFSDEFLEDYINQVGEDALTTVGAYRLESQGVQLFSRIEGDYFTILGLPLLACLSYFRSMGIIEK
jgi:septum formation protein